MSSDTPLKLIALKVIPIMPRPLAKTPKTSKSKEHVNILERRIDLWHKGKITELFDEANIIQSRLTSSYHINAIATISKKFKDHMQKGHVNAALKHLTNNMTGGILPLNDETLDFLRQKHPGAGCSKADRWIKLPISANRPISVLFKVGLNLICD